MGYVYTLSDPHTNEVRYIGQTRRTLQLRLTDHCRHMSERGRSHLRNWLRSLGMAPLIKGVDVADDDLDRVEIALIAMLRVNGARLVNSTVGGMGGSCGRLVSVATREKIRATRLGSHLSDEHRRKISDAQKARVHPPLSAETRRNISAAQLGHAVSQATREKLRTATIGKPRPADGTRWLSHR